ncbi:MAG: UbiA family prenyltransferase [Alphaproteobacteria bacterium]
MREFFALSRIKHGMLDIAMPALAILLQGIFPPVHILILTLFTGICGYISVYALNDLVGFKEDKQKFSKNIEYVGYSVETTEYHHPIARGLLSFRSGILWAAAWFLGAIIGSLLLNPIITVILLAGGILEFVYCRLLKVTSYRVLLSGIVKTCGPCAALLATSSSPSKEFFILLFLWVFFWEIGGQNIPADWNDMKEDQQLGAKTIPVCYGPRIAALIIILSLIIAATLCCYLSFVVSSKFGYVHTIGAVCINFYLLIFPAVRLYKSQNGTQAVILFDKASYYPLALLVWTLVIQAILQGF